MKTVLFFGAFGLIAAWFSLFGYRSEADSAEFFRLPAGGEAVRIFRSSGLQEPDANFQVLVRANARASWKALWRGFHTNSNPRIYVSKDASFLLVSECVPRLNDEAHSCGATFFSTLDDLQSGALTAAPASLQTDRLIRSKVSNRAAYFESQPRLRRKLGKWVWQDFRLKFAYERFWF